MAKRSVRKRRSIKGIGSASGHTLARGLKVSELMRRYELRKSRKLEKRYHRRVQRSVV